MFPFDLAGPQFLVFYGLFAVAALSGLYFARRSFEAGPLPDLDLRDPYLFACLKDGASGVVRAATLNLIDRGLLSVIGRRIQKAPRVAPDPSLTRVEQEVLRFFEVNSDAAQVMSYGAARNAAELDYENQLRRDRLLPDEDVKRWRKRALVIAITILVGMAGLKIMVALSTGHSNIAFLMILTCVAVGVAPFLAMPYRTALGDACLMRICALFTDLRRRAWTIRAGSGSRELLWAAALFGVSVLPARAFPHARYFKTFEAGQPNGGGWEFGVTWGSDSGGGAGGSGCGGGGGGCGGCGS